MSTSQLIKFAVQQFWKRPGLMLLFTGVPTTIGFLLLAALVFSDPAAGMPQVDPTELWHSMSVSRKLGVFAMIPLNTWVPFALGQAGVAWMVAADIRREAFGFIDVLRVVLRSARSVVPLFFLLTFLWLPAHAMLIIPGLVVAWFIGFTPMVVAVGGEGGWRAVRTSARIARQGQSFTLWLYAFFGVLAVFLSLAIAFSNLSPGYHAGNFVSHIIFIILIAALESVLNCALTRIYLPIPPAEGVGSVTSEIANGLQSGSADIFPSYERSINNSKSTLFRILSSASAAAVCGYAGLIIVAIFGPLLFPLTLEAPDRLDNSLLALLFVTVLTFGAVGGVICWRITGRWIAK